MACIILILVLQEVKDFVMLYRRKTSFHAFQVHYSHVFVSTDVGEVTRLMNKNYPMY